MTTSAKRLEREDRANRAGSATDRGARDKGTDSPATSLKNEVNEKLGRAGFEPAKA